MTKISINVNRNKKVNDKPDYVDGLSLEFQDTRDIEIFSGIKESFKLDGKSFHKIVWKRKDSGRINKTIHILEKHLYYLTGVPYDAWIYDNSEMEHENFLEGINGWIYNSIIGDMKLFKKYLAVNIIIDKYDCVEEFDLIDFELERIYKTLNYDDREALGVMYVMKAYLGKKLVTTLVKHNYLEIMYQLSELTETFRDKIKSKYEKRLYTL